MLHRGKITTFMSSWSIYPHCSYCNIFTCGTPHAVAITLRTQMTKGAVIARMHTQITCTLHREPVKWELVSCAEMSWHIVVMTNMMIRNGKTLHRQSVFLAAWQTIYHSAVIVQKELWRRKDWTLHYIYCAAPLMKMENSPAQTEIKERAYINLVG